MKADGLQRMLDFLGVLNEKGISYHISQQSPEAIMVTVSLVALRVEVEFFVDEVQFSVFRGSESVSTDDDALAKLIAENWKD